MVQVHCISRSQELKIDYVFTENFKIPIVRNYLTDFNIILQKCSFGDPLPRLFKPLWFVKSMAAGRGGGGGGEGNGGGGGEWMHGLFSLYIYIENL